jgi:hypothetical protein
MSAIVASSGSFLASALPETLPLFPLSGVVLLPQARLPLTIFEPRYIAMIESALGHGRVIGMIQPTVAQSSDKVQPIYRIGGAGKITSFTEMDDGRFLIALTGLCRFTVAEEIQLENPWRCIRPDWSGFLEDLKPPSNKESIDRERLLDALEPYFREEEISLDRGIVDNASDDVLVSSLVMICPLEPNEKQALLEAPDLAARAGLLTALLEMACMSGQNDGEGNSRH